MILTCVILAMAASTCAVTVTRSRLFEPLRDYPINRHAPSWPVFDNQGWRWLDGLLHCTYCAVHWTALVLVVAYRPRLVHLWPPADVVVTGMAVIALAAVCAALLTRVYDFAAGRDG